MVPTCRAYWKDPAWSLDFQQWPPPQDPSPERQIQHLSRSTASAQFSWWTLHLPETNQTTFLRNCSNFMVWLILLLILSVNLQPLTSGLSENFFFATRLRLPSINLMDFLRMSSDVSTSVTEWPVDAATLKKENISRLFQTQPPVGDRFWLNPTHSNSLWVSLTRLGRHTWTPANYTQI